MHKQKMHHQSCLIQKVQHVKAELKEISWLLMLCFADRKSIALVSIILLIMTLYKYVQYMLMFWIFCGFLYEPCSNHCTFFDERIEMG
jgi:hypothetical protein